jgi:transposase
MFFPKGVNSRIQYGNGVKAHAVYLSQYQLLPYDRIREYFTDQLNIPLSSGILYNFINTDYSKLEETNALEIIKTNLRNEVVLHADETGININGERQWLHSLCNAHHLRELTRAYEQDGQFWAETMRLFLVSLNESVQSEDGLIRQKKQGSYIIQYRTILKEDEKESPAPIAVKGKRGRPKKANPEIYLNATKL